MSHFVAPLIKWVKTSGRSLAAAVKITRSTEVCFRGAGLSRTSVGQSLTVRAKQNEMDGFLFVRLIFLSLHFPVLNHHQPLTEHDLVMARLMALTCSDSAALGKLREVGVTLADLKMHFRCYKRFFAIKRTTFSSLKKLVLQRKVLCACEEPF